MKYEMETHNGECGFCATKIPSHASICAGCGARWGSQSGATPEEVYLAGRKHIKDGLIMIGTAIAIAIWFFLTSSLLAGLALMILAPLSGLGGVVIFLIGLIEIPAAKNVEMAWWRKQ